MSPENTIKTVRIDFNNDHITSKTSSTSNTDLFSFDDASFNAYAKLFHNEEFVFGITNHIYDQEVSGGAAFIMSLSNYRLSTFYNSDYKTDSSIELTTSTEAELATSDSLSAEKPSVSKHTSINSHATQFDRHAYANDLCEGSRT